MPCIELYVPEPTTTAPASDWLPRRTTSVMTCQSARGEAGEIVTDALIAICTTMSACRETRVLPPHTAAVMRDLQPSYVVIVKTNSGECAL